MRKLKTATGLATLAAIAVLPSLAAADTVVPPGNSAANQYTETFPTSGGEAEPNGSIDGGDRSPAKVLGHKNANKLESKGTDGTDVANFTAETAPQVVEVETAADQDESGSAPPQRGGGNGKPQNDAGGAAQPPGDPAKTASEPVTTLEPGGSSGFGEVLGQATGSGSGQLGLLLPLLIIGTVIWSFNYIWRQRRTVG